MKKWSALLSRIIPSLIIAMLFAATAALCLAFADPSPVPSAVPVLSSAGGGGIGGWVSSEGGFVAAVVAIVMSLMAILKAAHDVCVQLHLSEPGWLGSMANVMATILRYLTGSTQPPDQQPPSTGS